ncbi:hypothetical protein EEW87_004185 [Janibacter melonis]|uniref:HNH nuclease domain-containing protein n=1 Tax=Janibacter melonis TaxID=262209 RepID=A0A5P8FK96_9MICO|nr:HNH endonuclease [Janibacter melonis]QFQ29698.2 hypothetical protein EEW87_004185 [Janibacter melonis]
MPLTFRKQPSGGRGEYELVGNSGGVSAADLMDHRFEWDTPFGVKDSEVMLGPQGGKRRLRITGNGVHVQRQAAALALLPRSIRDESKVSHGQPIVLKNGYILDIEVDLVSTDGGAAVVTPTYFIARSGPASQAATRTVIDAKDRLTRLQRVWEADGILPSRIRDTVNGHRTQVINSTAIGIPAEAAVGDVIDALTAYRAPGYLPGADPLPALEVLCGLTDEVQLPTPDKAPPELPEVKLRLESEFRQRRVRGASHTQFKKAVQRAYGHRCAFCGMLALDIPGLARSGVDAAHILPWGQFDLDVVQNGILLCKRDHWLFDSHVVLLRHDAGRYFVDLNPVYSDVIDPDTVRALDEATGEIPADHLPARASERPAPQYIEKLYEEPGEEA